MIGYNNQRSLFLTLNLITERLWRYMKITTRQLAVSALLVAADVLFVRVFALNTPIMKIGLGFAAIALCAMAYGPWWTAGVSALGDLLGSLLFPTGAYFPGFTVTAAITGMIFGLALYKREVRFTTALIAAATNCVVVSFLLNSALISYISGNAYSAMLAARAMQLAVILPVQCAVIYFLGRSKAVGNVISKLKENS